MRRVLTAKRAVFFQFDAFGVQFLVLVRRVVSTPASRALKFDELSHFTLFLPYIPTTDPPFWNRTGLPAGRQATQKIDYTLSCFFVYFFFI